MTQDTFQDTLRSFLRREPFQPFVIELVDGRQILVDLPHTVAMGSGAGGFITPEYDVIFFSCEQIRDIRAATQEAAS